MKLLVKLLALCVASASRSAIVCAHPPAVAALYERRLVSAVAAVSPPAFSTVSQSPRRPSRRGDADRRYSEAVSPQLRILAARAGTKRGRPSLRLYASSQRGEARGLAYFVLGYREYEAGEYRLAQRDLHQSDKSRLSMADFAEFFEAASAYKVGELKQAKKLLDGFSSRYPDSPWRFDALTLDAQVLLDSGEPERALQILTKEPRVRQNPTLALLLAQAFWHAQRLNEAATAFQDVYYAYPAAPEADRAAEALRQLERVLETSFPSVTDEVQTARAEALLKASRFVAALVEYHGLLAARPGSRLAERWRLGQARCWLGLKDASSAVDALGAAAFTDPALEAERLAILVEAYAQLQDETAMTRDLEQLSRRYPTSPYYASALFSAGNFYGREAEWENAFPYYKRLADTFPEDDRSRDAHWRVAWTYYLEKRTDEAHQALVDHIKRYPSSRHIPAALYWLGRLSEQDGETLEAQALYELLGERFTHTYYTLLASVRLRALRKEGNGEDEQQESAELVQQVARAVPPREAVPAFLCEAPDRHELLRALSTLRALGLVTLAERYVKAAASGDPAPDLLLIVSRVEAEAGEHSAAMYDTVKLVPTWFEREFSELPKPVWSLLYPAAFWKLAAREARVSRLDPYLVMGVIRQESGFNPLATSRANARGLMQLLPATGTAGRRSTLRAAQRLYDPAYNVRLGTRYLRHLFEMFHGNLEQALAAYNAGSFRVRDWLSKREFHEPAEFLETIPFRETRTYVEGVLRDAAIYRQLLSGSPKFKKCAGPLGLAAQIEERGTRGALASPISGAAGFFRL